MKVVANLYNNIQINTLHATFHEFHVLIKLLLLHFLVYKN